MQKLLIILSLLLMCAHGAWALTAADIEMLRDKAEQGDAWAQFSLGAVYYDGTDITHDYAKAFEWFCAAAAQNQSNAQVMLGVMYQDGLGVAQDNLQACMWYNVVLLNTTAEDFVQENIAMTLEELEPQMTADQVKETRKLADEWWQAHR